MNEDGKTNARYARTYEGRAREARYVQAANAGLESCNKKRGRWERGGVVCMACGVWPVNERGQGRLCVCPYVCPFAYRSALYGN